jgi:hypothetical protein
LANLEKDPSDAGVFILKQLALYQWLKNKKGV